MYLWALGIDEVLLSACYGCIDLGSGVMSTTLGYECYVVKVWSSWYRTVGIRSAST